MQAWGDGYEALSTFDFLMNAVLWSCATGPCEDPARRCEIPSQPRDRTGACRHRLVCKARRPPWRRRDRSGPKRRRRRGSAAAGPTGGRWSSAGREARVGVRHVILLNPWPRGKQHGAVGIDVVHAAQGVVLGDEDGHLTPPFRAREVFQKAAQRVVVVGDE